jgi:predicted short-subunit dehydrogenase-like oxidoreductase (DUF2520 family)
VASRRLHTRGVAVNSKGLQSLSRSDSDLINQSATILIATPDDAISKVAKEVGELLRDVRVMSGQTALHTSGALTSQVLQPIRKYGVATGSIHPLISISGQPHRPYSFSGTHFSIEGDPGAVRAGRSLARDLGGDSFVIDAEHKPLYHAAALMASPNLTALIDIAIEMLIHCGVSAKRGRQILLPLIKSTINNLEGQDPKRALTGTFSRGDVDTVKMHVSAIASERLTDAMRAYVALGEHSLALSGLSAAKQRVIRSVLKDALGREKHR